MSLFQQTQKGVLNSLLYNHQRFSLFTCPSRMVQGQETSFRNRRVDKVPKLKKLAGLMSHHEKFTCLEPVFPFPAPNHHPIFVQFHFTALRDIKQAVRDGAGCAKHSFGPPPRPLVFVTARETPVAARGCQCCSLGNSNPPEGCPGTPDGRSLIFLRKQPDGTPGYQARKSGGRSLLQHRNTPSSSLPRAEP